MKSINFDYYTSFCVCPGLDVLLQMQTLEGKEVTEWPVNVYNVLKQPIGVAETKSQYITIWNNDSVNKTIGVLSGVVGPFSFSLHLNPNQLSPGYVIGEPASNVYEAGVYDNVYE